MRRFTPLLTIIITTAIAILVSSPSEAYYGDPRFTASQPLILNRLLHNDFDAEEEFIVTVDEGCNGATIGKTRNAVQQWNDALRSSPNSITKYPFHTSLTTGCDDEDANILVNWVSAATIDAKCPVDADACTDLAYPITKIWIDSTASNTLVAHELGHSLWYTDQYYYHGSPLEIHCANGQTEGGHSHATYTSIMDCDGITESTDEYDFLYRYKPTYQTTNPTYPDTWGSVWNGVYYVGDIDVATATSWVEYKYFWEKLTDTNGSVLEAVYQDQDLTNNSPIKNYVINLGSRFCIRTKMYNEIGYTGTDPWSARSQHSCVGAAQSQNAGFLLATTDRANATSNTLYIRVKNFSGGFRNLGIFGPSFQNIGCGYQNLANGSTRQCYVTLTRGVYTHLNWYAWEGSNLSWGYVDFE